MLSPLHELSDYLAWKFRESRLKVFLKGAYSYGKSMRVSKWSALEYNFFSLECHEILLSVETYPIHFSFLRKLWVISIIGTMRMSKSKAELPSTDVLVNPQRPVSGTTALNSLRH